MTLKGTRFIAKQMGFKYPTVGLLVELVSPEGENGAKSAFAGLSDHRSNSRLLSSSNECKLQIRTNMRVIDL